MINGMNMNPQLQQLLKSSQASKQDALLAAFELGRASSTPVQTTAPFQATTTASTQIAPFATSTATTTNANASYPNVGSQLTNGQGSIRLGDLAKKFEADAGADKLFNAAELKAIGFPESSALALGRNGGIKFSDILDVLDPKATGGGWRREITPQGIDEALKGLIDQKGGPRATTDLAANKPMTSDDFAGLVNESFGLMGQEPPKGDELTKLFNSFAGPDGKLDPTEFKGIANLDGDKTFSLTEAGGNILDRLTQMRAQPALPYTIVGSKLTGGADSIGVAQLMQKKRNESGADDTFNMAELVGAGFPEESARALDGITLDELYSAFKEEAGPGWNPSISAGKIDEVLKGLIDARGGPRDVTNVATTPMDFQGFKDLAKKAMEFSGLEVPDDAMLEKMFKNIGGADGKVNKGEFEGGIASINPDDKSFSLTDAGAKLAALLEEIKAQMPEPSIGSKLTGGAEKMGLTALMDKLFGKTGADEKFQAGELGILPPELEGMTLDELYPLFNAKATGPAWNPEISAENITKVIEELVSQRSDPKETVDFGTPWDQQKTMGFVERAMKAAGKEVPGSFSFGRLAGRDNAMNLGEYSAVFGAPAEDKSVRLKAAAENLLKFLQQMG
jgi:hypothetical protein